MVIQFGMMKVPDLFNQIHNYNQCKFEKIQFVLNQKTK